MKMDLNKEQISILMSLIVGGDPILEFNNYSEKIKTLIGLLDPNGNERKKYVHGWYTNI